MINLLVLQADLVHLYSFTVIIFMIIDESSCKGISSKAFEIYLLVFFTRYFEIFIIYTSLYDKIMAILFIGINITILYLVRINNKYSIDYDRNKYDNFPYIYLILFALFMTIFINKDYSFLGLISSFSLWLESVAVFPIITIIIKNTDNLGYLANYLGALCFYKFFHIINLIYYYVTYSTLYWDSVFSTGLQILIYIDFFYIYSKYCWLYINKDLPTVSRNPILK